MRIELLTELLPLAMAIAANPPGVIAVVLMMSSEEAHSAATWFVAGWLLGSVAAGAFGLAGLFAGLNPKTLALNVAGAVVIAEVVPGTLGKAVTLAVFATVSSVTLLAPLVYGLAAPERAGDSLARLQRWPVVNNTAITAAVLAVLGVMVAVSALRDLL